jgi:hypothetical protein
MNPIDLVVRKGRLHAVLALALCCGLAAVSAPGRAEPSAANVVRDGTLTSSVKHPDGSTTRFYIRRAGCRTIGAGRACLANPYPFPDNWRAEFDASDRLVQLVPAVAPADVDRLTVGRTTRGEVIGAFGPPIASIDAVDGSDPELYTVRRGDYRASVSLEFDASGTLRKVSYPDASPHPVIARTGHP